MNSRTRQSPLRLALLVALLASTVWGEGTAGKVRGHLNRVRDRIERDSQAGESHELSSYSSCLVRIDNANRVQVYVYLTEVTTANLDALRAKGLEIQITNDRLKVVQGWAPMDKVDEIAGLDATVKVSAPDYAVTSQQGSQDTAGNRILHADDVRALGYTGSGVKVGIISNGVDTRQTAITSGDLPSTIEIVSGLDGTGDEGTAMLEIVHDLAPDAALAFAGPDTSVEMIQAIQGLIDLGCDIICDDLVFFEQPYFEDGILADAARDAVTNGVFYCTSANNHAESHYQGKFSSGGQQTVAGTTFNDVHDFGGGDYLARVYIPAGQELVVYLQWSNRFGASGDNYDLYLISSNGNTILARSTDVQNGDDNPWETLDHTPAVDTFADILINRTSGSDDIVLEFFLRNYSTKLQEHNVTRGSIFGHQAADRVFTVGAINASDAGNDDVTDYSGRGPSELYFPTQIVRSKPEACAIDGVAVTGAGGFPSPFFGTSAASPHVAGVGALLLQAKPTMSPLALGSLLQRNAVDIEAAGYDYVAGSGRIDALSSLNDVLAGGGGGAEGPPKLSKFQVGPGQGFIDVEWGDPTGVYDAVIVAVGVDRFPVLDVDGGEVVVVPGTGVEAYRGTNGRRLTLAPVSNGTRRFVVFATYSGEVLSDTTAATTVAVRNGDGINCVESFYGMGDCPQGAEPGGGGGGGGGCFIATAVYGSPLEPRVRTLRDFRDAFLKEAGLTRSGIGAYYANSPPVAGYLRGRVLPRLILRDALLRHLVRPAEACAEKPSR